MIIKKYIKFLESNWTPEDILKELSLDLKDNGLHIDFPNDNKFGGKFYLSIDDIDKVFCKNYPKDDMDWLNNKPIMLKFYDELSDFGFKRDIDFKLYGGGTGVNIVFDDKKVVKL